MRRDARAEVTLRAMQEHKSIERSTASDFTILAPLIRPFGPPSPCGRRFCTVCVARYQNASSCLFSSLVNRLCPMAKIHAAAKNNLLPPGEGGPKGRMRGARESQACAFNHRSCKYAGSTQRRNMPPRYFDVMSRLTNLARAFRK